MRRGQAAMEFLTSYGWAIMIVLIMVGALSYFGITRPDLFLPEKCYFQAGLSCEDFLGDTSNDQIKAIITNNFGKSIKLKSIIVDCQGIGSESYTPCTVPSNPPVSGEMCQLVDKLDGTGESLIWKVGEQRELVVDITDLKEGHAPKVLIDLTYMYPNEFFEKTITGEIMVKPK